MSMLEFPTFEQMVATMNDPVAPQMAMPLDGNMVEMEMEMPEVDSEDEDAMEMEMEMSTDDMITAMFGMMREMHGNKNGVQIGNGGKANSPNLAPVYDSNTSTYDGGVATMLYNGDM